MSRYELGYSEIKRRRLRRWPDDVIALLALAGVAVLVWSLFRG